MYRTWARKSEPHAVVQCPVSSVWHSWFIFGSSGAHILTWKPAVLADVFSPYPYLSEPLLRRLVASLSQRRPCFAPRPVNVVNKVALRHVFLRVLRVFPVGIVPPWFSILIYISPRGWTVGPLAAGLQRRGLTPSTWTTTTTTTVPCNSTTLATVLTLCHEAQNLLN
jgi:hypothetical protein